jgi:PAS domain S-box-containing protein
VLFRSIKAVQTGAQDYLVKGEITSGLLGRSIRYAIERKQTEVREHVILDTQAYLLKSDDMIEIYKLVAKKVSELIGDGIVATSILDEAEQAVRFVAIAGLDMPIEKIIQILQFDPTQMKYYLKDMTDDELVIFRSGKLQLLEGGLYALTLRSLPKAVCGTIEKMLKIEGIYTMGFVSQGLHYGGVSILARSDLLSYVDRIELIVNQAVIAINRLRAERDLRDINAFNSMVMQTTPFGMDIVNENGRILYLNPVMEKALGKNALGKRCWDLYKDDRQQCSYCPLKRPIDLRVTRTIETSGVLGGKIFEISHTGLMYQGQKAVLEVFHDITQRKQSEEEVRQHLSDVEMLYTSSLEINQLVQPQEIGQKVVEILSDRLQPIQSAINL